MFSLADCINICIYWSYIVYDFVTFSIKMLLLDDGQPNLDCTTSISVLNGCIQILLFVLWRDYLNAECISFSCKKIQIKSEVMFVNFVFSIFIPHFPYALPALVSRYSRVSVIRVSVVSPTRLYVQLVQSHPEYWTWRYTEDYFHLYVPLSSTSEFFESRLGRITEISLYMRVVFMPGMKS